MSATPPLPTHILRGGEPLQGLIIGLSSALLLISLSVVTLRLYIRARVVRDVRVDDVLIFVAIVCSIFLTAAIVEAARFGSPLGSTALSKRALKSSLAVYLMYYCAICALKLSMCSFCQRTYGSEESRKSKFIIFIAMSLVTLHFISAFGTTLFACNPVSNQWNPKRFPRHCVDYRVMQTAHATINAVTDLLVLVLTLAFIRYMNVDLMRRASFKCILLLGVIAVLASFTRIPAAAVRTQPMGNPSLWSLLPIFTALEVNLAIIAASLPSLGPLIHWVSERLAKYPTIASRLGIDPVSHPTNKPLGLNGGIRVESEFSMTSIPRAQTRFRRMEPRNARYSKDSVNFLDIIRQGPDEDERRLLNQGGYAKAGIVLGV